LGWRVKSRGLTLANPNFGNCILDTASLKCH
jgi:hypothetical protein